MSIIKTIEDDLIIASSKKGGKEDEIYIRRD